MRRLELVITLAVVALDQWTKALVRGRLELHESIDVVSGWLSLTRVHNTGAAFGMLNNADFPFKTAALMLVAGTRAGRRGLVCGAACRRRTRSPAPVSPACSAAPSATSSIAPPPATCSTSWTPTGAPGTSGPSMSPTPPSSVGVVLMLLDVALDFLGYRRAPNPA